ncbi:hypothetical protein V6N11_001540 [Hibiscus sabdariffa]|uniref:Uncharacterized protein n=1 Tax=Hibiscus sabdariffa TaxID=183260 RepID=A0ABR2S0A0_9ROSI
MVADMATNLGQWDRDQLWDLFTMEVIDCIATTPTPTERIFDAKNVERENVLAKGCRLINECEAAFVSSRSLPRIVARGIVADEKRCWEDHHRAAISPPQCCHQTDPGG